MRIQVEGRPELCAKGVIVICRPNKVAEIFERRAHRRPGHLAAAFILFFCLMFALPHQARAAIDIVVKASTEQGFGRLLLVFPRRPKYKLAIESGVLVIRFEKAIETDLDDLPGRAPDYIVVGRLDPDGKALRFALTRRIKINTIEAGEKLFIDLLPEEWTGVPPGLPQEVIAELARRAEMAMEVMRKEKERQAALAKKYKLKISAGVQPTFSRLAFDWTQPVKVRLERDGKKVTVKFSEKVVPDLSRLRSEPPRNILRIGHELKDDELWISFQTDPRSDVRSFQEGNTYIVDVFAPTGKTGHGPGGEHTSPAAIKTARRALVKLGGENAPAKKAEAARVDGKAAVGNGPQALPDLTPGVILRERALDRDGIPAKEIKKTGPATVPVPQDPAAPKKVAASPAPAKKSPPVTVANKMPPPAMEPGGEAKPKKVEVRKAAAKKPKKNKPPAKVIAKIRDSGSSLRITFPFNAPTSAAVFQRAKHLWIVFDTDQPIGINEIKMSKSRLLRSARLQKLSDKAQMLRLELSSPMLATASASDNDWRVSIGDLIVQPTAPITLKRGLRTDGGARVSVRFEGASRVHWLKDPSIGDEIAVVTGKGPPRGFLKPQNFVEFAILATAHGIAVQRKNDDLRVKLVNNTVTITNDAGLALSAGGVQQYSPGRRTLAHSSRPGFIDFAGWSLGGPTKFSREVEHLEFLIAAASDKKSISPRLELSRLYLAHRLGAEALGQMKRIVEIDPEIESDPLFNAMRGVANLMMGRLKAARRDLSVHGLSQDRNTALWLGLTEARAKNWRKAQLAFIKGEQSMAEYPEEIQAMFRVAATRAAIETNDLGAAEYSLNVVPKNSVPAAIAAEVLVLRGRLYQGLGRSDDALEVFAEAAASGDQKAEAEARFHSTMLKLRQGMISDKEAVPKLEAVSLMWRGDDLELRTLRNLALLYTRQSKYRQALTVMRTAIETYPEQRTTRLLQDDMSELFAMLYLNGGADALQPVAALGLYYDFRALTPVGRKGDEMIRRLADRLISVDLLDQAAEILNHQVDKRLTGAARAQVAARLAIVHLLGRKPARALQALRRTRQSVLPGKLKRQRVVLEARALAELARADAAVSLLENLDGADIDALRALAYWNGEKWQKAGEAYEKVLAAKWKGRAKLKAGERLDALRAAISYSLAEDNIGLRRLAEKFSDKMRSSADGRAFRVVTHSVDREGVEFRNLAKEIAGIDTLESFIADFRKTFDAPENVAKNEGEG